MLDYFEMERVIEELAKAYPAQCATTWFKITKKSKPSSEEYRDKVVEYMKQFEYLLATYPHCPETDKLKDTVKRLLAREIERVLKGDNKDVERRHKHYVDTYPYYGSEEKKVYSETPEQQLFIESSASGPTKRKKDKNNSQDNTQREEIEEKEQNQYDIIQVDNNSIGDKRRRKRKLTLISG